MISFGLKKKIIAAVMWRRNCYWARMEIDQ